MLLSTIAKSIKPLNKTGCGQDSLGMSPLHVLACSTNHHLEQYEAIIKMYPGNLIHQDKWGCIPLLYAIWMNAPDDIVQLMVDSQRSVFPNQVVEWEKMVETLCRTGSPPNNIKRLLDIQQTSFSGHTIDWEKVARELVIGCIVRCDAIKDCSSNCGCMMQLFWSDMMMESFGEYQELCDCVLRIQMKFLDNNWQRVCEGFVEPLGGWWSVGEIFRGSRIMSSYDPLDGVTFIENSEDPQASLATFRFLVRFNIAERVSSIRVRKWRLEIETLVVAIPSTSLVLRTSHFDAIHFKLMLFESWQKTPYLLELALWKHKVEEESVAGSKCTDDKRVQCRIRCGAQFIIPSVLSYLFDI